MAQAAGAIEGNSTIALVPEEKREETSSVSKV
jgi:hypothetical protein